MRLEMQYIERKLIRNGNQFSSNKNSNGDKARMIEWDFQLRLPVISQQYLKFLFNLSILSQGA